MNPQDNHAQNHVQDADLSVPLPGQGSMPAPVQQAIQANRLSSDPQTIATGTHTPNTPNKQNIDQNTAGTGTLSSHAPQIADDVDLIEKEWVNKAKLIVAKTKDDPREQSKELYKYKADYIKKRYNKDIKVSET